jgi:hypothetical protein
MKIRRLPPLEISPKSAGLNDQKKRGFWPIVNLFLTRIYNVVFYDENTLVFTQINVVDLSDFRDVFAQLFPFKCPPLTKPTDKLKTRQAPTPTTPPNSAN